MEGTECREIKKPGQNTNSYIFYVNQGMTKILIFTLKPKYILGRNVGKRKNYLTKVLLRT